MTTNASAKNILNCMKHSCGSNLYVVTTALRWTEELELTINSTDAEGVSFHIVCLAEAKPEQESKGKYRFLQVFSKPGCSISEGFNSCISRLPNDAFVMIVNEGDRYLGTTKLTEALEVDPSLDGVVGSWICAGVTYRPKRLLCEQNLINHGLGFAHSAAVVRRSLHDRFGLYPETYKIVMDFALFLDACRGGARFAVVPGAVVEIERPGISARILPTALEHSLVLRKNYGAARANTMFVVWVLKAVSIRLLRLIWRKRT
jgi:hypothetical protein